MNPAIRTVIHPRDVGGGKLIATVKMQTAM
jgi:hypothetical protein